MTSKLLFSPIYEKSTTSEIINVLSVKKNLSIKDIHSFLSKTKRQSISYQTVHKSVKKLLDEGYIKNTNKAYNISDVWIKNLKKLLIQYEMLHNKKIVKENNVASFLMLPKTDFVLDSNEEQKRISIFNDLIPFYREMFKLHNIFQNSNFHVMNYLLSLKKQYDMFIVYLDEKILGATVLELKDENMVNGYKIWKLKHFAIKKGINKDIEEHFLSQIENILKQKSKKFKIQSNLAENEKENIALFKRYGFSKEATIKGRYREGEKMFIYMKTY